MREVSDCMPVLITLDHNTPAAPVQRVDYLYVRPPAAQPAERERARRLGAGVRRGAAP